MAFHRRLSVAEPRSARFALTLVAAFAFFIQSFLTQTHIHGAPPSAEKSVVVALADAGGSKNHDPYPANEDPSNCPLCQEIVHAGHYVAPVFALLIQPAPRTAHVTPVVETRATEFVLSHAWRSRAPPIV